MKKREVLDVLKFTEVKEVLPCDMGSRPLSDPRWCSQLAVARSKEDPRLVFRRLALANDGGPDQCFVSACLNACEQVNFPRVPRGWTLVVVRLHNRKSMLLKRLCHSHLEWVALRPQPRQNLALEVIYTSHRTVPVCLTQRFSGVFAGMNGSKSGRWNLMLELVELIASTLLHSYRIKSPMMLQLKSKRPRKSIQPRKQRRIVDIHPVKI